MANINKSFVKSPTGICLIVLTILSFIATILTQFYCYGIRDTTRDTTLQGCTYLPDATRGVQTVNTIYGSNMAAFALSFTWIASLILFFLKLCQVQKADLKCWRLTDYIMSAFMLVLCFIGLITLVANMIELDDGIVEPFETTPSHHAAWIAATVFLAADIGILIFMIIAITRHYKRKEGVMETKHQKDVKEGMDHPSLKIKSISLSKQGSELKDPKTEPTAVSSRTQLKTKQVVEVVEVVEVIPPIPEPQPGPAGKQSEASLIKNKSEKTQTETEKTQASKTDIGAKPSKTA